MAFRCIILTIQGLLKQLQPEDDLIMRIFVSWTDLTGTNRNTRINLTNCSNTTTLLKLICKELSFPRQNIIVKLKTQPVNLVVVDNWPISQYPLRNGSFLTVQLIEQSANSNLGESLGQIEQEQDFLEDGQSMSNESQQKSQLVKLQQKYGHYLQQSLNNFLEKVREGNLADISSILKEEPLIQDEQTLNQLIILKNKYLVNEMGDCGRNALHWAIHMKQSDIVAFLLIKGTNPTAITLDGYTPLQLAVLQHDPAIVSLLLEQPKLDPNQVTSHGTALHLAVRNEDVKCLQLLLQHDACPDIKDSQGKTPLDICCACGKCKKVSVNPSQRELQGSVCNNCRIKAILQRKAEMGKLSIPNISKGPVYRVSSTTYRLKQRLLLVNPFKRELVISHLSGEVEDKIPLTDFVAVQVIEEKSWLMKSKLQYWRLVMKGEQKPILFAVSHPSICKKWVQNIATSLKYSQYSQYIKPVPSIDQTIELLDDQKGQITLHKRRIQEKPKVSSSIMNLKPSTESQSPKRSVLKKTKEQTQSLPSNEDKYRESEIMLGSVIKMDKVTPARSSFQSGGTQQKEDYSNRFRKHSESRVEEVSEFVTRAPGSVTFTDFDIIKQLGVGAFGKVYLARYRATGVELALKVLNKKKLFAKKQLKYAVGETTILKKMDSPFIVRLHCCFQTPNNLYLALDHCPHGDLAELIAAKDHLKQSTAKFIIAQLILAIEYLHKQGILYRDLKPENILIGKDGYIRLTDFGLSRENSFAGSFCGSPAYLSPEMLERKGVGVSSDIYGIGCVLYEMVVGEPPYFDEDIDQLFQNIKQGRLRFPSALSQDIRSLLSQLLERDIKRRLGTKNINDIKQHPFFSKIDWPLLESKRLSIPRQILVKEDQEEEEEEEIELQANNQIKLADHDYSEATRMVNRIKNFTFVREGSLTSEPELPTLQRGTTE